MMTREDAEKELIAMLEEAEGSPTYLEEVDAYHLYLIALRGLLKYTMQDQYDFILDGGSTKRRMLDTRFGGMMRTVKKSAQT